ncbi:MAG: cadherin-like domain-containing protein, partial [Thermoplasmatales archaeon]|nr:cadherin-like domain-containing protein [Thermoplasmatales archaeon]
MRGSLYAKGLVVTICVILIIASFTIVASIDLKNIDTKNTNSLKFNEAIENENIKEAKESLGVEKSNDNSNNPPAPLQITNTSIDTITPYIITKSPLSISATGPSDLDIVTLYYRYSDDNISWPFYSAISIIGVETNTAIRVSSLTINKPAGLQDNDVLFAFIVKRDDPSITGPSGWTEDTQQNTITGDDLSSGIWYKIVTDAASEPTSYTWTGDRERWSGGIAILRGVNTSNPIDAPTSQDAGTNNANPTCPSITTNTDMAMVFACAALTKGDVTSSTPPTGTTKQWELFNRNANSLCANFTQIIAGAIGNKTWSTNGGAVNDEEWHTYQVAFRPAYEVIWTQWYNASNPDNTYPWSWNFDFPNSTGYYEFYSIGNKTGEPNETAPTSADAKCYFNLSINDPPVANNDSYTVDEGGTLNIAAPGVLQNDTDPDNDSLVAVLDVGPSYASSFTLNSDGSFNYTHDGGETAVDSFTYHANDSLADSNVATVTITVNPVNDAPLVSDIPDQTIDEGDTFTTINLD